MAALRSLSPGELIGNKYSIVRTIGSGGMGIVYEALHQRLGQRVAVKMLLPELVESEEAVARFEREARAAAHLHSLHAARVFDVDAMPDGTPYFVMEYLKGRNLADELAERGRLPIAEAVDYVLQACDAMAEAHQLGIVHRDLKPSNLFLASDGHQLIVKVLDFGISKFADGLAPLVTTTRTGLGTVMYMSPEQVRSARGVDARSDVWALGVVLYELLSGCSPFEGDTSTAVVAAIVADKPNSLRGLREEVPSELEAVVMQALQKNRERRFLDAAAFGAALVPFGPPRDKRSVRPPSRSIPPPMDAITAGKPPVQPHDDSTAKSAAPVGLLEPTRKDKPGDKMAATPPDAGPLGESVESSSRDGDTLKSGAKEVAADRPIQVPKGPRITDGPVRPIIITAMPSTPRQPPEAVKQRSGTKRTIGASLVVGALLAAFALSALLIWQVTQDSTKPAAISVLPTAAPTPISSAIPSPPEESHAASRPPEIVTETPPVGAPAQAPPTAAIASAVPPRIVSTAKPVQPAQPRVAPRTRKPSKTPMQESTGLPADPG